VTAVRLATPLLGADYTSEIPTGVLNTADIQFVYRYCSRYAWKVLKPAERVRLKAAGIGVCVVFEDAADNALKGYEQGKLDAEYALNWAHGMGMPAGRPMAWAVDCDVNPAVCDAYSEGWAAVWTRGLCSPYGSAAVVGHFADRGFGCWFQTYAWSAGVLDGRARVHQWSNGRRVGGYDVDLDHAWYADYGQWDYRTPPAPAVRHYERYPELTRQIGRLRLSERATVTEFDRLALNPKVNAARIMVLRGHVRLLRDRVWTVAHRWRPADWGDWRGWRWQQLNARLHSPG
jgi:Domain of unknown function (DUF1906)